MGKKDKRDKRDKKEEKGEKGKKGKKGKKGERKISRIASAPSSLIAMTPAMDVGTVKGRIVDRRLKDRHLKDCRIDTETATWMITLVDVCKGKMTVVASWFAGL